MVALRNDRKVDQLSFPMIIAMKGTSSAKKSEIANKLASYLQYPLIDEEDVILALEDSISDYSSPTEYDDKDLPFQIVSKISSTQISLKLSVIVNSELSQSAHFDHLVQLASSEGARLLIIEFEDPNNDALPIYDVGNVPKLSINASKPFVVDEFVRTMFRAAEYIPSRSRNI